MNITWNGNYLKCQYYEEVELEGQGFKGLHGTLLELGEFYVLVVNWLIKYSVCGHTSWH